MECLSKVATSVVPLVVAPIINPIIEHVMYPFKVGDNVRDLESATTELVVVKEDVNNTIRDAEREDGVPTNQVQEWLRQVECIENEAHEIVQNYRRPRRCLFNLCPNIRSNYIISKRATRKLIHVSDQKGKKPNFNEIMRQAPRLTQAMPTSLAKSQYIDLALHHLGEDMNAVIGIWGMGGVGKTHLLKQINNLLSEDHVVDVVMFVTCSKECSEQKVQDAIIERLKLGDANDMEIKAGKIYNFLKQRSFVLLLDDLWNRVDLEKVGVPTICTVDGCKRKIVLTTRSKEICGQMEVNKMIKVNVLNASESSSLFKEKVTEETIKSHPLIPAYAEEVVRELCGLPLALITIGRAMHGREDPSEWEHTIEQLKQARLHDVEFSGTDESVFHILKFSYDSLKIDALKECFLLCSLWPEDYPIKMDEIVMLWMGLGLIDEPEIQRAYNVGYNYIKRLEAACLLETTEDSRVGNIGRGSFFRCVKMHDVIRDMALWIANNQGVEMNRWIFQMDNKKNFKEKLIRCETEKLSLIDNEISELSFTTNCGSTKLSTLLLNLNLLSNANALRLDLFPQLTVLDLSFNQLTKFPVALCNLVNLQFLNFSQNSDIKSLPKELGNLINLKYLVLRYTSICTIPYGIVSKLSALRVLDLSYCDIGGKLIPILLEELQFLREFQALGISIVTDTLQFEKLIEVTNVSIRWLQVSIQNEQSSFSFPCSFFGNCQLRSNLFNLAIQNMDVEWVKFEGSYENSYHFERLDELRFNNMGSMKEIIWKGVDPKDVLPKLQDLTFYSCHQLRSISWVVYLPSVRQISLFYCENMKQLIYGGDMNNSEFEVTQPTFPSLRRLHLLCLDVLESISDPKITFPVLEELRIRYCPNLIPFKTNNIPNNLKTICCEKEWWNGIQWDNASLKSSLQFVFDY